MSYDINSERLRCDRCGKYMKREIGSSWVFVPDSQISIEEDVGYCKACTKKHGKPVPWQTVNIDMCSGIVK
jgi:hypothetical protein